MVKQGEKLKQKLDKECKRVNRKAVDNSFKFWNQLAKHFSESGLKLKMPIVGRGSDSTVLFNWIKQGHFIECEIHDNGFVDLFYRNESCTPVSIYTDGIFIEEDLPTLVKSCISVFTSSSGKNEH